MRLGSAIVLVGIVVTSLFLGSMFFITQWPVVDFSVLENYSPAKGSVLLDDQGEEWARFQLDRREMVRLQRIPAHLVNAFLAAEDHAFFSHSGISLRAIMRSLLVNITHGKVVQGASTIRFFYTVDTLVMPRLVGRHLQEAVKMLSDQNLNIRIAEEKETTEVPEGTILSQIPLEGQKIKPYQSIFLVLSQRASLSLAPSIQGLPEAEAVQLAHERQLDIKRYRLFSSAPTDTCIAQIPAPSVPLTTKKIISYISAGDQPYRLMPNFKNLPIREVSSFLRSYTIEPHIFHGYEIEEEHTCDHCVVLDQRPFPGTLVNISQQSKVQLRIGSRQ